MKLKKRTLYGKLSFGYEKLEKAGITKWPLLAAALSYYTSLAVVPFLAICLSVAKGLNLEDYLKNALNQYFNGKDEILEHLYTFVNRFVESFSGGLLVLGALIFIFWSAYRLLGHLENIFGQINGYRPPRRTLHKVGDYLTIVLIVPLVLIASGIINFYLSTILKSSTISWLDVDFTIFLSIFPYFVWWIVLAWAYSYFSYGIMGWAERLIGGLIASIMFQLFQTLFFKLAFTLTSYNAIYGSFALVPLFLIWLYYSWLIVILGAEITRRFSDRFLTKTALLHLAEPITWNSIVVISLKIMAVIRNNYEKRDENGNSCGSPTNVRELAIATNSPLPILGEAINYLLYSNILCRVSGPNSGEDGPFLVPTMSVSILTDEEVVKKLENISLVV